MFLSTVRAVKLEVRPLFLPQLVRLTAMLKPGLHTINVSHLISVLCPLASLTINLILFSSGLTKTGPSSTSAASKLSKTLKYWLLVYMTFTPTASSMS